MSVFIPHGGPDPQFVQEALLAWYDRHARVLPWRVGPHEDRIADPYHVWLSEVMLQQTTVAAVKAYYLKFLDLWPDVEALAAADDADVMAAWAGLGYYARARNLLACARQVAQAGGFPRSRAGLRELPGIGDYTSAAIASIAFGQSETVVDGNVERVTARLFAVTEPLPAAKKRLHQLAALLTPLQRAGDFAQAMMDLGATICSPRNPVCALCPLNEGCAGFASGLAASLPARLPKTPKPQRRGVAWVMTDPEGRVLVEERAPKGLLGGVLAFPSSGWDGSECGPPAEADWREAGSVNHIFTHFALDMEVRVATSQANPQRGFWQNRADFDEKALPGLFRKVWKQAFDS